MKTKRHLCIAFAFALFFLKTTAQDTVVFTLQKCIDLAQQHNLSLASSSFQQDLASIRSRQAWASMLPSVNAWANQGISTGKSINPYTNAFINQEVTTGQYGANANLMLFNGLSNINALRQAVFSDKAGKKEFEQAQLDLKILISLAYLQVLSNEEMLAQAQSQMQATQSQLDRLSVLEKNNAVSPSVLYDTKGQLSSDKLNLLTIRSALFTAKQNLSQAIGVTIPATAKFDRTGLDKEIKKSVTDSALVFGTLATSMPSAKAAVLRTKGARAGLFSSVGSLFPALSLNGSIGTNYSSAATNQTLSGVSYSATDFYVTVSGNQTSVFGPQYSYNSEKIRFAEQMNNNFNSYIGLSLQVPVFNGLRAKSQIDQTSASYKLAKVQEENAVVRNKAVLEQAYNDLSVAFDRYKIVQEQANDFGASYKIAVLKFEKGAISTVEFMSAKTNAERSASSLIVSRYEFLFRELVMKYYSELK